MLAAKLRLAASSMLSSRALPLLLVLLLLYLPPIELAEPAAFVSTVTPPSQCSRENSRLARSVLQQVCITSRPPCAAHRMLGRAWLQAACVCMRVCDTGGCSTCSSIWVSSQASCHPRARCIPVWTCSRSTSATRFERTGTSTSAGTVARYGNAAGRCLHNARAANYACTAVVSDARSPCCDPLLLACAKVFKSERYLDKHLGKRHADSIPQVQTWPGTQSARLTTRLCVCCACTLTYVTQM